MIRSAFTKHFLLIPFCIFFLFLIATLFAWKITSDAVMQEEKERFYQNATTIREWVQQRVDIYILAIEGLHGFLGATDTVTQKQWAQYIQRLQLFEKYPGISSISYVKKLDNKDKKAFIETMQTDSSFSPNDKQNFSIYPQEEKDTYYVVKYIEPLEGREKTIGFDMGSETKRLKALEKARDTGEAASTGKIIQVTTNKPGFGILSCLSK